MFRRHYCTKSSDAAGVCSCDILCTCLPPKKTDQSFPPPKNSKSRFHLHDIPENGIGQNLWEKRCRKGKTTSRIKKLKSRIFSLRCRPCILNKKRSMPDEATSDGGKRRPYGRSPRGFLHSRSATHPSHHTYCRLPTSS